MLKEDVLTDIPANTQDCETERNKPIPNRIHGTIQTRMVVLLDQYSDRYQFSSEVTLDTTPPSTPDILVFPKKQLNWKTVEAREKEMPITTIEILSPRGCLLLLPTAAFPSPTQVFLSNEASA